MLRAIEAQHGVLVERAHNIHSFSHLSFQEYFTARYIVENEARGATTRLIRDHLTDERWKEVFLLTASLLDNADAFASALRARIDAGVGDGWLLQTVTWADAKAQTISRRDEKRRQVASLRLAYFSIERNRASERDLESFLVRVRDREHALNLDLARTRIRDREIDLARALDLTLYLARARERESERAHSLSLWIHPEVGIDYELYRSWAIAEIMTQYSALMDERSRFVQDFPQLLDFCREMDARNVATSLARLPLPRRTSRDADWRALTDGLWQILEKERGFLPPRELSQAEYYRMNDYFYANELLVRCLELAYVTNRQEILDNLLRPPSPPPTD